MTADLPNFRFNPRAYELGYFVNESGKCDACGRERELKYRGSFYCVDEVDYLCPWCVADGTAARTFGGEFNDWLGIEGVPSSPDEPITIDVDESREVSERTPSYPTWQQEQWKSHCGRPCAFVGDVGADDLQNYLHEHDFAADVNGGTGYDTTVVRSFLEREGDLAGYLFRCLSCGAHRLHVDAS
ncbi:CbrC family protein [Rhodococcus sp. BP-252]|uniref:CbrC family protein n=1 Tax=Rhodococcoides kyotonense TaxID=398843 RepID=A0A177YP46_9NOCA|nr:MULTISPECIES: CbrC family protein [Rhodococcus]NIL78701.1 protein CbrC [Rhodococcus sp. B10]MBY6411491.1 CbrC family protein [Rhodococcus sp. BP-320]MBY6416150.1 CbrC family protein [Rhodococcus sp. BP-321]MBY6423526.1 CbrC family protein [Rhodococcus sp. BP-324]MBY6426357.1 CbrC family protein [Rhodococcus sp. BP-323]